MDGPAKRVGEWELLRELGRGSNGVVYAVTKPGLGRELALKVLLDGTSDEAVLARFELEARVASKLDDPGVVGIHEFGRDVRGRPYFVMDLCRGKDLRQTLAGGPLPVVDALEIAAEVARILSLAHGKGVIHRDVKPANIMMDPETGRPRLMDFGLARDHSVAVLTRSGDVLGTPIYMAPEQLKGSKGIDHRVDLYALGAVLYQCLTGRPPHVAASIVELAKKVGAAPPQRPSLLRPEVPARVDEICLRALAKDPRDRHPDAGELRRELLEAIIALAPRGKKRSRAPLAVAALVGVAAVATLTWLHARRAPPPPPPSPPTAPVPPPKPKQKTPEAILRANLEKILEKERGLSIAVLDGEGRPLLERNEGELRPLGACMELVTSAVALRVLPDRLVTVLEAPHLIEDGAISDLAVVGGGDPSITDDHVKEWVTKLKEAGLKRVLGDIVVDARRFDTDPEHRRHPSWPDDLDDGINPRTIRITALALHDACVTVKESEREPFDVTPRLGNLAVRRAAEGAGASLVARDGDGWKLALASRHGTAVIPVEYPELYFGDFLRAQLEAAGITVAGKVRAAQPAESLTEWNAVFSHEGLLDRVLWYIGHNAKAWYAECVFHAVGAAKEALPATWEKSEAAVKSVAVTTLGAPADEVELADGSGYSPKSRMSARALARVLGATLRDQTTRSRFETSLAQLPPDALAKNELSGALEPFRPLSNPFNDRDIRFFGQRGSIPRSGVENFAGEVRHGERSVVFAVLGVTPGAVPREILGGLADYVAGP